MVIKAAGKYIRVMKSNKPPLFSNWLTRKALMGLAGFKVERR
jgi:hypothetical protein